MIAVRFSRRAVRELPDETRQAPPGIQHADYQDAAGRKSLGHDARARLRPRDQKDLEVLKTGRAQYPHDRLA